MSKSEHFLRYGAIVNKLRNNREATFDEISDHLERQSEITGQNLTISKRTFQRDVKEIWDLFKIEIQYNFSKGVYHIEEDTEQDDVYDRLLESSQLFNSANIAGDNSRYLYFEKRKPQGMENFYLFLHVIKNRHEIRFVYNKFWEPEPTNRIVEPYALKEFRGRWYLYAKDLGDNHNKTFGLDRISEIVPSKRRFKVPQDLNLNELFKNCFGIISPDDQKPEEVILSFEPVHGKYIKSYPLHSSQVIKKDNDEELLISLRLYITHDFIMELLSYGHRMKVISPKHLKDEVCEEYTEALKQYPAGAKSKLKKTNQKTYFLLEEGRESNSFLKDNEDFGTMERGVIE